METCISFYLKSNRIQVFTKALRGIGSPRRICFMISSDGQSLLLVPYEKRDLKSHNVPPKVYQGEGDYKINSYKLCRILAGQHHWDLNCSYRILGKVYPDQHLAVFDLASAIKIHPDTVLRP